MPLRGNPAVFVLCEPSCKTGTASVGFEDPAVFEICVVLLIKGVCSSSDLYMPDDSYAAGSD